MKLLKIVGVIIAVLVAAIAAVPYAFRDQIEACVKEQVNNMLDANVDYNDFSLSIFSSFPDLRAGLEGVSVIGRGRFDGDTLVYADNLNADIKIMPLLDGDIMINSILVESPIVRAIVAADSTANWNIYKSESTEVAEEDTTSAPVALNLDKVLITNADVAYIDSTMNLMAHIKELDTELTGEMIGDLFNATIKLNTPSLDIVMDNIKYLSGSTVDFNAGFEADLASNKYTFKENTLNFSGVPLAFDGFVQLLDSSTLVNLKLAASETSFKTLLALIPDYIMKDVEGLKMDGSLELYADVNGEYVDMQQIPAIDMAFKVKDGVIKYPDLPKSLNDINVDVTVKNPGGDADLTKVDVNKLHFELGSNPFDASLNLVKPMSNPTFEAKVNGTIDLNSLKDALPLDSMSLAGVIKANLKVATDMAAIEKEDYENVKAEGVVDLSQFSFESNDLPQSVNISEAKLEFTPKYLNLDPLKATLGQSDFYASGKVESYLPYVLSDGTIKGSLTIKSDYINCNELLGDSAPADTTAVVADPNESSVVEIPKNIDFTLSTDIKKLLYDKLTITNLKGGVVVRDGIAKLKDLKLNACDGEFNLDGTYNTVNIQKPSIDMVIGMNEVDVNMLASSFSTVDSLLPIAKKAHGKVSVNMSLVSELDQQMSPVLKTMNGKGSFRSQSLSLKESDFQKKLSKVLGSNKFNEMTMKDFKGSFTISEGSIVLVPFDFKLLSKKATLSGRQGLDQAMDYLMSVPFSREEIASLVNKTGIKMSTDGDDIPVGIKILGTLSDPDLKIDTDALKKAVGQEVKEQVKEKVTEVVDKAKEEVKEKVTEKVAEELKDNPEVKKAADKIGNLFKKKTK
ncbi:MAG: AsmA family protein [Bacteroidales bacterium]|nr:AsmA family protein [Bacteroidales bacterium]